MAKGWKRASLLFVAAALLLMMVASACSKGGSGKGDSFTLRVAMGSPGEGPIKAWEQLGEMFEKENPHIKVEYIFQSDDIYETIGLVNLLNGENPPDIYFEWAGERLNMRYEEGFAADLSEYLDDADWKERFDPAAYNGMRINDGIYMVPSTREVSNMIWYNKKIFADLGLKEPANWAEWMEISGKIKEAGIVPMASGNKDLWAAGNWIGHLVSRVVGEDAYSAALTLEQPFNTPEFAEALSYAKELWDKGYINDSVNAISDNEGAALFFNGQAAMHPIGSWLLPWALEEAPDLEFDFFNLPAIPGARGDQSSVLQVATGYMVNAKSEHIAEAMEFLKMYTSPEVTQLFVAAGQTPAVKGALDGDDVHPLALKINEMMNETLTAVAPPDVGYNLEVASAFYMAISQVLGGAASPEDALAELDRTIAHLK